MHCISQCVLSARPGHLDHVSHDPVQILRPGPCAALLSPILRLLLVANRSVRLEHNAARGYVPLLYLPLSNT